MRTISLMIGMAVAGIFCGCQQAPKQEPPAAEVKNTPSADEMNKALVREADDLFDEALLNKLRQESKPPARVRSHVEILENEKISMADAERAWMYRQAATERCFNYAMAVDDIQSGNVTLTLKRDAGAPESELVDMSTDIQTVKFDGCIRKAQERWRLPEGARLKILVKFSTLPPLTAEDLENLVPNHRHDIEPAGGHDHE